MTVAGEFCIIELCYALCVPQFIFYVYFCCGYVIYLVMVMQR
jgi:hypothetical protein